MVTDQPIAIEAPERITATVALPASKSISNRALIVNALAANPCSLQNLFILHDPSFDEELRKAAIYIADRKVLFKLVEAAHYSIKRGVKREQTGAKSEQKLNNFP